MMITTLVGNPSAGSRTLRVAHSITDRIAPLADDPVRRVIDLAEVSDRLFLQDDATVAELRGAVVSSDVVVIASPTYKATYTGLLKAFLDGYGHKGLRGVTAIPVMTGNAPQHALGVEVSLRPLLVELGASVPTSGLYFLMDAMDRMDEVVDAWFADNEVILRRCVS